MANSEGPSNRRRYSFVDVLERVSDGVHVQIVGREKARVRDRAEDSSRAPGDKRSPPHAKRRTGRVR